jgi:hypothetical protein
MEVPMTPLIRRLAAIAVAAAIPFGAAATTAHAATDTGQLSAAPVVTVTSDDDAGFVVLRPSRSSWS